MDVGVAVVRREELTQRLRHPSLRPRLRLEHWLSTAPPHGSAAYILAAAVVEASAAEMLDEGRRNGRNAPLQRIAGTKSSARD